MICLGDAYIVLPRDEALIPGALMDYNHQTLLEEDMIYLEDAWFPRTSSLNAFEERIHLIALVEDRIYLVASYILLPCDVV